MCNAHPAWVLVFIVLAGFGMPRALEMAFDAAVWLWRRVRRERTP